MTQAFNLSQLGNFVNSSGQLNAAAGLYNQTPVANGGTGKATVTAGAILAGAGTANMVEIGGTTAGTILAASPTGWAATAASVATGGNYILNAYTSPATWTKPTGLKAIKVTVQAGGGNGAAGVAPAGPVAGSNGGGGSGGGASIRYIPAPSIPGPVAVTVGAAAGTSSFSTFASATGGGSGSGSTGGTGGVGTLGTVNFSGQPGSPGSPTVDAKSSGGGSLFGIGRRASGAGQSGTNFGAGGSGGILNATPGPGTAGIVMVEEYY